MQSCRVGLPKDISGDIALLAEPAAGFVSGTIVNMDAGYHLWAHYGRPWIVPYFFV